MTLKCLIICNSNLALQKITARYHHIRQINRFNLQMERRTNKIIRVDWIHRNDIRFLAWFSACYKYVPLWFPFAFGSNFIFSSLATNHFTYTHTHVYEKHKHVHINPFGVTLFPVSIRQTIPRHPNLYTTRNTQFITRDFSLRSIFCWCRLPKIHAKFIKLHELK